MKRLKLNDARSTRRACSFILITSLLLIWHCHCYIRSNAMIFDPQEPQLIDETVTIKEETSNRITELIKEITEREKVALEETKVQEVNKTVYKIPSSFVHPVSGNTVRYRGGKTLERSSKITYGNSGIINDLATPDQDGFMKLNDRYLIAIGSRFGAVPGQYIDLVLENGIVIECIMGDAKADRDTDSTNTFTYKSRCCSEFIIDEHSIASHIYERGNASLKNEDWDSPVVEIIVYDDYYEL